MKRSPLRRKTPLKRTRLRRVSKKRAVESLIYYEKRNAFLAARPFCEFESCHYHSRDVHHMQGRGGSNYLDETTWMAICRLHHNLIHDFPNKARKLGYLK